MDTDKRVAIASAEGIANGLLIQSEKGIKLTSKGMVYTGRLWGTFNDLDKLLLAGYLRMTLNKEGEDGNRKESY